MDRTAIAPRSANRTQATTGPTTPPSADQQPSAWFVPPTPADPEPRHAVPRAGDETRRLPVVAGPAGAAGTSVLSVLSDSDRTVVVDRRHARVSGPPAPGRPTATTQVSPLPITRGRSATLPFRRVVQGVLVGAVTMLAVATLDAFAGATVPVLGTFAALPNGGMDTPAVVEVPSPPSQPGLCLTWTRKDAADAAVVDCSRPHLFEQAGSVTLTDQPTLPGDGQWRQLVSGRCDPVVMSYLDGKFDPDGRYRVGALKPSPLRWAEGDRELRCGLQRASQSGALYPMIGTVAGSDQSDIEKPGTCLGISGKQIGDPVACTRQHAVEIVGTVDLGTKFTGPFPAVTDQDAFLQPACAQIASAYAGGPQVITAKKLTVYWDDMTPESWAAGSRKVNCNLGALLPDRSGFAPVTGSVKGAVAVGSVPAPPATATPAPGVPADAPPSDSDPSGAPGGGGGDPTPTGSATPTGQSPPPTSTADAPPSQDAPPTLTSAATPPPTPQPSPSPVLTALLPPVQLPRF